MSLKRFTISLLALGVLISGLPSQAAGHARFGRGFSFAAQPFVLNDDGRAGLRSSFVNFQGQLVLSLQKLAVTSAPSSVGAFILGVRGVTPTTCGFDFLTANSWSGPLDPLINLVTTDGVIHQTVGSKLGTLNDLGTGWTRVTFDPTNSGQTFPVVTPGEVLSTASLVMFSGSDALSGNGPPGFAIINNIQINNIVTSKLHGTQRVQ
jgi:hypothetical protein